MAPDQRYGGVDAFPSTVLEALGHRDTLRILEATLDGPMSAAELIEMLDVPRTTLYRRIESFAELDLVRVSGDIVDGVGPEMTVETNLADLALTADDGEYRLDIELVDPVAVPQERP